MSFFPLNVKGHVKIWDKDTEEVLVDKDNSINYENLAVALCQSISAGPLNVNITGGPIYQMVFGNGGTVVSQTGIIEYLPPNVVGVNAQLYNETFSKVVNQNYSADVDTTDNYITVEHITGTTYSDILVNTTLVYTEPAGQAAFDNTTSFNDTYTFDELGLMSVGGQLLTHVIFSPIQKSLNRSFTIQYSVRISALTTLISQ